MNKLFHAFAILAIAGLLGAADGGCGGGSGKAETFIAKQDYKSAIAIYEKEIAEDPQNSEAYYGLGKVYFEMRDFMKAKESFDKTLELNPESEYKEQIDGLMFTMWAMAYNDGINYYNKRIKAKDEQIKSVYADSAAYFFKQGIEIRKDTVATYNLLASVYNIQKKTDKATKILEEALQNNIADEQTYEVLSKIYLFSEPVKTQEAIKVLKEGVNKYPKSPVMYRQLGLAYLYGGNTDDAKPIMKKAVELAPKDKYMWFYYGLVFTEKKTKEGYEEAVEKYNKALELDPNFSDATYNLAIAYVRLAEIDRKANENNDKYDGYKAHYTKAVEILKPAAERDNKKEQWHLLGKIYAETNQIELSKEALEKEDAAN